MEVIKHERNPIIKLKGSLGNPWDKNKYIISVEMERTKSDVYKDREVTTDFKAGFR
jgi:hypothetical protein